MSVATVWGGRARLAPAVSSRRRGRLYFLARILRPNWYEGAMMRTQPRESRRYHGVGHLAMSATAACPRLALLLLGLGYASCSAVDKVTLPPRLSEAPGDGADLAALADARRHFDQHRPRAALRIVEDILSRHPKDVDSQRVRQDILRERGRQGLVLREAEDRLAAEPTAAALYLSGRVQSDPSTKQQRFRAAIERDPGFFWGWFGLAFSLREEDPRAANRIYKHLYEETHQHERAALTYAASLLRVPSGKKRM